MLRRQLLLRSATLGAVVTTPWPALAASASASAAASEPGEAAETRRVHALFERHWEQSARHFPESATYRGDHRFDDRLTDASDGAVAARDAWERALLDEARTIRREALAPADRLSLDLFIERGERAVARQRFDGFRRMSLRSSFGFQTSFAGLLRAMPARDASQVENILRRMAAYPRRVDQEIARVRPTLAIGWVPSRSVLTRALAQLDGQLALPAREGPFFEPLRQLDERLPVADREALRQRVASAIDSQVLPAQRALRRFMADELLPAAPADGGLGRYPDGAAVYAQLVADHTTTRLTPHEVHAIGRRETARLHAEMRAVQREMGIPGDFAQFVAHLNGPQYFHPSAEAMLDGLRAIAKRIDPEMPKLFAELPRVPYGIRPMPAFLGPDAPDNYNAPPPDGTEPGWYNANTQAFQRRPRWALPTLVAHEAVPGHHLQSARAREIRDLPAFRRQSHVTAYGEGWALYAETLGQLIGLYDTPETRFGHLRAQAFRAARLVVDTGLHALGWTRQQAIDFMVTEVGESPSFVGAEVDRYLSNPGQALAYMVGGLKFAELRDRAKAKLGARFDLRRFHNAVLDDGPLPLTLLEQQVDRWIAAELAAG